MRILSWKKVVIFFLIPLGVSLALIAMYFSGVERLQHIVSPRMPRYNPNMGREFGLLENLQNVVILAMCVIAGLSFLKKQAAIEKAGMAFIALFSLFILLEEMDYGLHFYEYFRDIPWKDSADRRNLHNVGDVTQVTKQIVDAGIVLLFLVAPLALARVKNPWVRYLTPDRYSILTVVAMVIVRTLAHGLEDRGIGARGTIHRNLSEFRELVTYYLFLLYLIDLALRRTLAQFKLAYHESEAPSDTD